MMMHTEIHKYKINHDKGLRHTIKGRQTTSKTQNMREKPVEKSKKREKTKHEEQLAERLWE
jgi:hypothetical protein